MERPTSKDQDLQSCEKPSAGHHELIKHDELTEEEEIIARRLRRKTDIRIMPLVILVYLMNYIDRYLASSDVT